MSARTSSARPPLSAWMKLACFSETCAVPSRKPFRPAASISRPAESPGGLMNTEPALEPPGWCSRRHRTMLGHSARSASASPRCDGELRLDHQLAARHRRRAVPVRRRRTSSVPPPSPTRSTQRVAQQTRRHVRAVAARVHADGPAHRAGDPHRPGEPGPSGVSHLPGQHGKGAAPHPPGRAPGGAGPSAPAGRRQVDRAETLARGAPPPRRSRHRPPAGSSPGRSRTPARAGPDETQAAQHLEVARVPPPRRRGPPDRPPRRWSSGPAACPARPRPQRGRPARRRSVPVRALTTGATSSNSSGSVVRSPAPRVRQRSPGRRRAPHDPAQLLPARRVHDRQARVLRPHGVDDQASRDPRDRRLPGAVDVGHDEASASAKAAPNCSANAAVRV